MPFQQAPRRLAFLLATLVVARLTIAFVVHSPLSTAAVWSALLAALSLAALSGRHLAATGLAYLCVILGADTLLQLLSVEVPVSHLVAALLWASLAIGVGVFILRSKTVQRFYAAQTQEDP